MGDSWVSCDSTPSFASADCRPAAVVFSVLALEQNVPGYIVFPITTGGNLFMVAAAGVLLFREKIGPYGLAGILIGILSIVLLSIG